MTTISEPDEHQIDQANSSGRTPVVFIHGLWLLPSSWDRWANVFEQSGYAPLTPGWPDDPATVNEAKAHPEVFANKTIGQVADHYAAVIEKLDKRPAVIGHSFGGLLAHMVAGRGLSVATVAIDAAQRPIALSAGTAPSGPPAWKTIPSWDLIGTADHVIPPAEQLFMAQRAGAHISEINAGHLSLISHPGQVTRIIIQAARATS